MPLTPYMPPPLPVAPMPVIGFDTPNAQRFQYVTLPIPVTPIASPEGDTMNTGTASQPITHWMDSQLAHAWIVEASRVAGLASVAAIGNGDPPVSYVNEAGYDVGPIDRCLSAILRAYNAMNIPWYMDPEARRLWRLYISGTPQVSGGRTNAAAL